MHITFVNRYFWPESVLVNDIARWAVDAGHKVTVLTGQPDYNPEVGFGDRPVRENWEGVGIRRITLFRDRGRGMVRNFNMVMFGLAAALRIVFGKKTDCVWSTSIPPIVQPILLRLASWIRGAEFVYFPQDIYPEIAVASDLMTEGWTSRLLRKADAWMISKADRVVTISDDMKALLLSRSPAPRRVDVIRSFSPVSGPRPERSDRAAGPYRFIFAGNIGRFQNLDALVEAFAGLDDRGDAVLELLGAGRERARLEAMVEKRGIGNVRFHDFRPVDEAFAFTAECDVGIVSLRPGIYRYAFPAKFYNSIGAGLPLLVFVERESELARIVEERGLGIVVEWTDPANAVGDAIRRLVDDYDRFQLNVATRTDDLYRPDRARSEWMDLFAAIAAQRKSDKDALARPSSA